MPDGFIEQMEPAAAAIAFDLPVASYVPTTQTG
jgi:hypothetical protein